MIRNVHDRELAVPAEEAGALLDTMGGPGDALWPVPAWPAMCLDRPLRVGSAGGHGPIRYRVTGYLPGRMLECTFDPGIGLIGTHTLTVEPLGPGSCRLRHELRGRLSGTGRLTWPLAIRWLHDALLEDLLDRAERRLGGRPARPAHWSPWVRLLNRFAAARVGRVVLGTVVALRNRRGRLCWSVVRRVHPYVVRAMPARAARRASARPADDVHPSTFDVALP